MENIICDYYFFHSELSSHRLCLNFDEKEKIKKILSYRGLNTLDGNQVTSSGKRNTRTRATNCNIIKGITPR